MIKTKTDVKRLEQKSQNFYNKSIKMRAIFPQCILLLQDLIIKIMKIVKQNNNRSYNNKINFYINKMKFNNKRLFNGNKNTNKLLCN